jgi:hypothetical protein
MTSDSAMLPITDWPCDSTFNPYWEACQVRRQGQPRHNGDGTVLDPTKECPEAEAFERELRIRIVGQDRAIRQLARVYQVYLSGLSAPGRPLANLLLLGPTGSGKTRLVEATAEALSGDSRAVVKIDCAEFQHSHEIAKLVGSPPGYLGHRETLLSKIIDFPLSANANKGFRTGLVDKRGGGFDFVSALPVQITPAKVPVARGLGPWAAYQKACEANRASPDR